jgi:hypothetical protein
VTGRSPRPVCQIADNERTLPLDPLRVAAGQALRPRDPRPGLLLIAHLVRVGILEHHHHSDDDSIASTLWAGIACRAEELVRLVEEGAPRRQIDGLSKAISHLHAKLHIHEIRLRETGRDAGEGGDA